MFDFLVSVPVEAFEPPSFAFIGAAIGAIGGLIGNKMTNDANRSSARAANEFTEKEMKNRHQWEVSDLKAAGLNPILSAGGTPSMGHSAQAPVADVTQSVSAGVNSALAAKQLEASLEQIKSQTDLNRSAAGAQDANAVLAKTSAANNLQYSNIRKPVEGISGWADKLVQHGSKNIRDLGNVLTGKTAWKRNSAYDPVKSVWKRLTD